MATSSSIWLNSLILYTAVSLRRVLYKLTNKTARRQFAQMCALPQYQLCHILILKRFDETSHKHIFIVISVLSRLT